MTSFASAIQRVLLLCTVPCLMHCAESSMSMREMAADTGWAAANDAATSASTATYSASDPDSIAVSMNIDATLAISSGAIDLIESTILTTVYEGDEEGKERCTQDGMLEVDVADMPKVKDELHGWWLISTLPSKTCTDVPEQIYLGIGAYNSLLDSAVTARGRDPQELDYSVYAMLNPQSPLWVFGIAEHGGASTTSLADSGEPATESGLPNGLYAITGMLLIPL